MAFRVPNAPVEKLETIVRAYAHKPGPNKTADIVQASRLTADEVGRSIRFLQDLGLLEGGNEKAATSLGESLAKGVDHGRQDDIETSWRQAVRQSETLTDALTNLRINGGSSEDELAGDILYKAEIKPTPRNRKGAGYAIDVLKKSALIEHQGDLLVLASSSDSPAVEEDADTPEQESPATHDGEGAHQDGTRADDAPPLRHDEPLVQTVYRTSGGPEIAINIQLEIPPATDPAVYDNLFRSLAEHLLPKQERQVRDDS